MGMVMPLCDSQRQRTVKWLPKYDVRPRLWAYCFRTGVSEVQSIAPNW